MPLKLSVGVSRKVGQPGYGSIGASCGVELDLDQSILRDDPEGFERRARQAHAACARAVDAELARLSAPPGARREDDHHADRAPCPIPRLATPRQLRALGALARARGVDPDDLLAASGFDAGAVTAAEASRLISGLRSAAAG